MCLLNDRTSSVCRLIANTLSVIINPWLLQVTVFNSAPSLTSVTGDLITFSAGMPTISPLNNLETVLLAGETTLNSAPYTSGGSAYKTWLTTLRQV